MHVLILRHDESLDVIDDVSHVYFDFAQRKLFIVFKNNVETFFDYDDMKRYSVYSDYVTEAELIHAELEGEGGGNLRLPEWRKGHEWCGIWWDSEETIPNPNMGENQ